jgi:hypothetical protein
MEAWKDQGSSSPGWVPNDPYNLTSAKRCVRCHLSVVTGQL